MPKEHGANIDAFFILSGILPDLPFPYTAENPRFIPNKILISQLYFFCKVFPLHIPVKADIP